MGQHLRSVWAFWTLRKFAVDEAEREAVKMRRNIMKEREKGGPDLDHDRSGGSSPQTVKKTLGEIFLAPTKTTTKKREHEGRQKLL